MDTTRISLLLRIRNEADADAWAQFDAIYRPILRRYSAARGLQDADIEDVVQYSMSAIHKHIKTFEYDPQKGRFKAWLRTIVNNRVANLLRHRREHVAPSGAFQQLEARETAVEQVFEQVWMEEHLRHAFRVLQAETDPTTFAAFEDYAFRGTPAEDICLKYGLQTSQLYKIKWRLTRRLKEIMATLFDSTV